MWLSAPALPFDVACFHRLCDLWSQSVQETALQMTLPRARLRSSVLVQPTTVFPKYFKIWHIVSNRLFSHLATAVDFRCVHSCWKSGFHCLVRSAPLIDTVRWLRAARFHALVVARLSASGYSLCASLWPPVSRLTAAQFLCGGLNSSQKVVSSSENLSPASSGLGR